MEDITEQELLELKHLSHKKSCRTYYQTKNKINQAKRVRAKAYDMNITDFDKCETIDEMDKEAIIHFTQLGLSEVLIHRLIIKRHKEYRPYKPEN